MFGKQANFDMVSLYNMKLTGHYSQQRPIDLITSYVLCQRREPGAAVHSVPQKDALEVFIYSKENMILCTQQVVLRFKTIFKMIGAGQKNI